jgi:trk system potassium uptake protein TrkH
MSRINFKLVFNIIAILLMIEGIFMIFPIIFSLYYKENDFYPILISAFITLGFGAILFIFTHKNIDYSTTGIKESYIIVSFTWILIGIFGSLPFILSGTVTNFIDAFFECVSGFTTTGASILTDIEIVPKGVLFWRSLTHWIGGMGIIVLILAILPMFKKGSTSLFSAEVSDVTKEKIHARVINVANRLWIIYLVMSVIMVILLLLGGMNIFESLCHMFGTLGTGGYSTKNSSIAAYSPYIQYVVIIFMFLSGINFSLYYFFIKKNFKRVFLNEELIFYSVITIISSFAIFIILYTKQNYHLEEAFRHSLFQVVSILTTTGYITDNYLNWPVFAWLIIVALFFVGGCAGSTGGGIKVIRHLIFFKSLIAYLKKMRFVHTETPIKYNGQILDRQTVQNIIFFIFIYLLVSAISIFAMVLSGIDIQTSFGAVMSSIGCIGPGIGTVGPVDNYAHLNDFCKILLPILMILGRLEIYTFLVLLVPNFWRT